MSLHDGDSGDLARRAAAFIDAWTSADSPVGHVGDRAELRSNLRGAITDEGLGVDRAWSRFVDVVVPSNLSLEGPRFLSFIPMAPAPAAVWMDAIVGAVNFSAESWLEAAGAVAAEEQVLELLADTFGLPDGAGGCFMSGGSIGNLSALAVARDAAGDRRVVVVADTAHASVDNALRLLGMEAIVATTGDDARLTGDRVLAAATGRRDVAAVVAAAGSTNAGVIDDLASCADAAHRLGAWLHVDGAYGLAAAFLPELRPLFDGIERADSLIVDPHKWLFAPAGSCALLYRRPELAAQVHTQHGPYIEALRTGEDEALNPSDLGFQLTRRATGLPLWFSLAVHGVDAHRDGIRHGIALARSMADALDECPHTELVMGPTLGVVLFRRHGWGRVEWSAWARRLLDEQIAFVAPTTWRGEPVGRLVFLHPRTPETIVPELIATLAWYGPSTRRQAD